MEQGYGGPVWHASVAHHGRYTDPAEVAERVRRALRGVGDAGLGEWWETGPSAMHCRRRVTAAEWADRPWGMDLRKTAEGDRRLEAAGCPRAWSPDEFMHA
jgi:hypothetical protein